jgi:hypothetical protein
MALKIERIVDGDMHAEEALGGSSGCVKLCILRYRRRTT